MPCLMIREGPNSYLLRQDHLLPLTKVCFDGSMYTYEISYKFQNTIDTEIIIINQKINIHVDA